MTLPTNARHGAPGGASADILLIDDNPEVRSLLERTLSRAGYEVISCTDGHGALSLLSRKSFRLVITDIFMPGMDGYEVIMKVNASEPKPKVLAISGGTLGSVGTNLRVAKNLGCERVLAKPFELPEFYSVIREMIGAPAAEVASPAA